MPNSHLPSSARQPQLRFINPTGLYDPAPHGYSHVAIIEHPARTIYIAGQGGENASGVLEPDFAAQVAQGLRNLVTALAAAHATIHDVAKLTALIVDNSPQRLQIFSQAVKTLWGDAPTPTCTLIPVPSLALDGMLFEIDAIAVVATGEQST